MSNKIRIYLAGTIYREEPGLSWKKRFIDILSPVQKFGPLTLSDTTTQYHIYEYFDPDPINEPYPYMIARDKKEIEKCDLFVAYIEHASVGTIMEVYHAFNQQSIPILIINPSMNYQNDLWLKYHSHLILPSVEDCATHIKTIRF